MCGGVLRPRVGGSVGQSVGGVVSSGGVVVVGCSVGVMCGVVPSWGVLGVGGGDDTRGAAVESCWGRVWSRFRWRIGGLRGRGVVSVCRHDVVYLLQLEGEALLH